MVFLILLLCLHSVAGLRTDQNGNLHAAASIYAKGDVSGQRIVVGRSVEYADGSWADSAMPVRIDPAQCDVSCPSTGTAGETITCIIRARSSSRYPAGTLGDIPYFEVGITDSLSNILPTTVTEGALMGMYSFSFTSMVPETYTVCVSFFGTSLGACDTVDISPDVIDWASSVLSCSPATGTCTIAAKDVYGNPSGESAADAALMTCGGFPAQYDGTVGAFSCPLVRKQPVNASNPVSTTVDVTYDGQVIPVAFEGSWGSLGLPFYSCKQIYDLGDTISGSRWIRPLFTATDRFYEVWCNQDLDGGGFIECASNNFATDTTFLGHTALTTVWGTVGSDQWGCDCVDLMKEMVETPADQVQFMLYAPADSAWQWIEINAHNFWDHLIGTADTQLCDFTVPYVTRCKGSAVSSVVDVSFASSGYNYAQACHSRDPNRQQDNGFTWQSASTPNVNLLLELSGCYNSGHPTFINTDCANAPSFHSPMCGDGNSNHYLYSQPSFQPTCPNYVSGKAVKVMLREI